MLAQINLAHRLTGYRERKAYGITMEEFATAGGVAAFNIAGKIANDRLNKSRVAAGQQPLGPFANIESATIYGQTAVGLGLAMKKRKSDIDRVGKVMFLASFPSFAVQLIRDVQLMMGQTPIVRQRAARNSAAVPRGFRAPPMAARPAGVSPMVSMPPSLAQEIAYAGGIGR